MIVFCFINNILEEVTCHAMYSFSDRYSGINQNHVVQGDWYIMTFITYWGTLFYIVMPFRFKHETLIMMFAVRKYRYHILINKNIFYVDHVTLCYLVNKPNLNDWIVHWI